MNLVSVTPQKVTFLASPSEKEAWCELLRLYPIQADLVQPPGRTNAVDAELLREALASQRGIHRRELETLLHAGGGFVPQGPAFKLTLKPAQLEMVLQVLNDLRVGSWQALGSPNLDVRNQIHPAHPNFRHLWVMDVSGHFQMALLEACSAAET